jgi:hypothetical protein
MTALAELRSDDLHAYAMAVAIAHAPLAHRAEMALEREETFAHGTSGDRMPLIFHFVNFLSRFSELILPARGVK